MLGCMKGILASIITVYSADYRFLHLSMLPPAADLMMPDKSAPCKESNTSVDNQPHHLMGNDAAEEVDSSLESKFTPASQTPPQRSSLPPQAAMHKESVLVKPGDTPSNELADEDFRQIAVTYRHIKFINVLLDSCIEGFLQRPAKLDQSC